MVGIKRYAKCLCHYINYNIKFEYRPGYVDTSVIDDEGSTPNSGDDNGNNQGGTGGNIGDDGDLVG